MDQPLQAVTGAFSFTGRAIARQLLASDLPVLTLVRRADAPDWSGGRLRVARLAVDDPPQLVAALEGVDTLYDTLWIRFERGPLTFDWAVDRSRRLLEAARAAGVRRLVHIGVVNASPSAPTEYFRAKARLDALIAGSGLSYAIVRPTLTYGEGDILVNNLCWVLRRFPLFGVPGNGQARLQPVHVDDVAQVAIRAGQADDEALVVDAAGPEVLTFDDFVKTLRAAIGSRAGVVHLPPMLALAASRAIGLLVRDVMLTADEVRELTTSLLVSAQPPTGPTDFRAWVAAHGDELGQTYHSELARHYRPAT